MVTEVERHLRTRRTEVFRAAVLRSMNLFWKGLMGVFETDPIQQGTIAKAVTEITRGGAMLKYREG